MNFADYVRLEIPEGRVKAITRKSDDLPLWSAGYVNQVPLSIDTDGSIYNGCGYIEGYRLSSSGALKSQEKSVATGFIPFTATDIILMAGAVWTTDVASGYCYIVFYDKNFAILGTANRFKSEDVGTISNRGGIVNSDKTLSSVVEDDGVTRFDIAFTDGTDIAYVRISATGNSAEMIVTVNEEIVI